MKVQIIQKELCLYYETIVLHQHSPDPLPSEVRVFVPAPILKRWQRVNDAFLKAQAEMEDVFLINQGGKNS